MVAAPKVPSNRQGQSHMVTSGITWAVAALILFLCFLLLKPFLPAVCWAFVGALIVRPLQTKLSRRLLHRDLAAAATVLIACTALLIPGIFFVGALVREAAQANWTANPTVFTKLRELLESWPGLGTVLRWIDARVDLSQEGLQAIRALLAWVSRFASSAVTGSTWAVSQFLTAVLVLFYFVRDGDNIVQSIRTLSPFPQADTDYLFARIGDGITVLFYGKVLMACIQGTLGGFIFWILHLPAPAFWALIMALLSIVPALGAPIVWVPAAVVFALQGAWIRALVLVGWGILIIHPVDNLLGPVLIGTKLKLHTLLIFFSVLGGLAAFGASGLVIGPVTVIVAVTLLELRQQRASHSVVR
ncbi:MAG: AI-2E family transporter [Acidobacteriaceae bacterium]|nr:AI-2E family transporter [Acidobacteriaceae bacterium]